jgi:hypothetical protein
MPLVTRNVQTLQLLISAYSPTYVQAVRVDRCRNSPTGLGRAAGDLRTATSAGADERLGQGQQADGCRPTASGGTTYGPTNAVRWRRCNRLGLWSLCFTRGTRGLISSSCTIRGDTYDCVLIRKKPADVAIKIGYNSVETVEGCILNGFQSISVKVELTKN